MLQLCLSLRTAITWYLSPHPMLCSGTDSRFVLLLIQSVHRVFRYATSTNRFSLVQTCSHSEYCQLRVKVYPSYPIAFVSSTDGLICAYDFSTLENSIRSTSIKVHQSGVNDLDLIEAKVNDLLRLASVGDDGSVHVTSFDIKNWTWKRDYAKDCVHQSPATGKRKA